MRITIDYDHDKQAVTKIDAPDFKSPAFLAAVLHMVLHRAEWEANIVRVQAHQQQVMADMQASQQVQGLYLPGNRR